LKKPLKKKGLAEWLKVKPLSSNSSTVKRKTKMKLAVVSHTCNLSTQEAEEEGIMSLRLAWAT
jgi:hypothetical protein